MNNLHRQRQRGRQQDQHNARVDHTFSEKNRAFLRYTYWTNLNLPIDPYETNTCVDRCTETMQHESGGVCRHPFFSPDSFRDLRLSFTRFSYDRTSQTAGFDLTQLGWPAALNNAVVVRVHPIPLVTGYNGVWSTNGTGSTIVARNDVYSLMPEHHKNHGHAYAEVRRRMAPDTHNYYQQNTPSGHLISTALMTVGQSLAGGGTGNGFASFLLGWATGGGVTHNYLVAGQMIYNAAYAGDQWQMAQRLTLNYGIALRADGPWTERFDRMVVMLPHAPKTS